MSLLLEVRVEATSGSTWREIGRHNCGERRGSLSNVGEGKRDILRFEDRGDHSIVERSRGGIDTEARGGAVRLTVPLHGWQELARLGPGETFEFILQTDRMPISLPARFRHE